MSVGKPTWGDNRLAYKQRFEEFVQQRFSGLAGLVRDAGEGYPQRLIDYFESNSPRKLSQNEWSSLFWLFNKLPRSGRPRGSVKPKNLAIQCASYLVRWGKRTQRLAKGKTTKAVNEKLYKRAVELMEVEIPQARGEFDVGDVRAFTAKPSMDVIEYVREDLEDALREMDQIALEN